MNTQYLEFASRPGFATLWDTPQPNAIPVATQALQLLASPNVGERYTVECFDGNTYQVVDTRHGAEFARFENLEGEDYSWTVDAEDRATDMALFLNLTGYDWQPKFEED